MKKHVHAEVIHAWADGAEIQYWSDRNQNWITIINPMWRAKLNYRIKPSSRYLNVYDPGCSVPSRWWSSVEEANRAKSTKQDAIGYLEDKQDGSPYIFHHYK